MNESQENARFMRRTLALARKSHQHIERFWRIRIDVTNLGASILTLFSPIITTLFKVVKQVASASRAIRQLSLTKVRFLPPLDLWLRKVVTPEEDYFPTQMEGADVSFQFNVNIARKTAAKLAKRVVAKTPSLALTPDLPLLLEAELIESSLEEVSEEPIKTVPNIVADLQSRLDSKVAPTIRNMTSARQEYRSQTFVLPPFLALHKPSLAGPSRIGEPPSHPMMAPAEKEAPQIRLVESTVDEIQVPSPPQKAERVELPALGMIPVIKFRAETARSFGYATGLPAILPKREIPIAKKILAFTPVPTPHVEPHEPPVSVPSEELTPEAVSPLEYVTKLPSIISEQKIQILNRMPAFSLVPPPKSSLPSIEPTPHYPRPATLPSIHPSQMVSSLEEISPSLTSWIYPVFEVLRDGTRSLFAVPPAASTAEKVVTETLIQPVSSVETPWTLTTHEPDLTLSRPETESERIEVEAFKLPLIVTSLVIALSQRYPLLFSGPEISETWGSSVELTRVAPVEPLSLSRVPEVETFSKLPTVIALATAESLIAQKLQYKSDMLIREMQVVRPSYGERLSELSALSYTRTAKLSEVATAPTLFTPREIRARSPVHWDQSVPPRLSKPSPVSTTVRNNFNITISAESTDQDLRDLERKINRILSEQIRRYYGSTRI